MPTEEEAILQQQSNKLIGYLMIVISIVLDVGAAWVLYKYTIRLFITDINPDRFSSLSQQTISPFLIFVGVITLIMVLLAAFLIHLQSRQVGLMAEIDRQKDELLSIVSHQLATPVSAVKWYLEMMHDGDVGALTKEQEEHVGTMQTSMHNLADLIHLLLDVSRIQLDRMKVDRQPLDLAEFFEEMLTVIRPMAEEKKLNFTASLPISLPTVSLDKRLMTMAVENILTNAVKYTPEKGTVTFTVELNGKTMRCSVRDTGCGIPKAEQEKVFSKLFRASNATDGGNGFGLYIAKGAVESQGGKIWLKSKVGKGTTFFIELPLVEVEKES